MNKSKRNDVQARWCHLRIFVMIVMLLLSVFLSASGAFAAGNEILVDISSATTDLQRGAALRAAIATATNGDTVVIPAGIYDVAAGGAGINVGAKAINLRGAGSGQTILDGSHITSSTTANAAVFKQRIDDTTKTITFTGITFQNGGTSKSSGIDFICYHDATPGISSTLILNDIAVTGNRNAGVNINSANVIANGLRSSGNGLAGVSIGDPHGSASFVGNDYVFSETYTGASTINKKVGVYIDKAQTSYTVNASYKDAIKVAQATFASSATATETPTDNFVVTGSGLVSRFYLGLPDPTSIALPQGSKTLTEGGNAIPMTENQFSFSVNESVSGGAVSTNTIFSPTMDASGLITLGIGNIPISSAGTYTYTVRETGAPSPGYTQDTNYFEVSYIVSKGATALTASSPTIMKYDSNGNLLSGTAIQFVNTYSSSGSGEVAVTKQLTGTNLTADMFSFTIVQTDGAGNAIANGYTETVGNNADGSIPFSSINLTKAGSYYYTITENKGTLPGITYDDRVIKVTMTATDNGQGNLTVTASYDGGQAFSNSYAVIPTATAQPTGSPIPQPPKTGDASNIVTWLVVCALFILGLVTLIIVPSVTLKHKWHGSAKE
ncbi:MAG TPA: FctA domain-containing protein [Candidatus Limiplasma sp.]|nr:FctA domain-containing protein [Candidatus Limiplasma sp.]